MRFAEDSVPKITPADREQATDEEELHFCSVEEGAAAFLGRTGGKVLFVSDERSLPRLAFAASHPRAISVVPGGDALPLFAMPEGVGAVFAAGGEETIAAARFFAGVRGVPCAVAPADAALFGVYRTSGRVRSDGCYVEVPLSPAHIVCDEAFMAPTLGGALARIALARLARFEVHALAVFGVAKEAARICEAEGAYTPQAIVRANAALRRCEAAGAWEGEGASLARLYPVEDAYRALGELSAVYSAFFRYGRPRKYVVPRYAQRAKRAGTEYAEAIIPTCETFARRAVMLERRRADLMRELEQVLRKDTAETDSVYAFSPPPTRPAGLSEELRKLPEHCPEGLCAIIRDFGLLEEK